MPGIDELLDLYMTHLRFERGLAKNSLKGYGHDLSEFVLFLDRRGIHDPKTVTRTVIMDFLEESQDKNGLVASSIARRLVAVKV